MAVFRPTYVDKKTGERRQSAIWWYAFYYRGHRIRESSGTTRKSLAVEAERKRRLELERAAAGIKDKRTDERFQTIGAAAECFLADYLVRHRSARFATGALKHIVRLLGRVLIAEVDEKTVKRYQTERLKEGAAAKTINGEVLFLLRLLGEAGDVIRLRMRRERSLHLRTAPSPAKAFSADEREALLAAARKSRSPHIYTALMLALHAGLRDGEIRNLQWRNVDLERGLIVVGESKTAAGTGRTIPMNRDLRAAILEHARRYLERFGETRPEWFLFAYGKPWPSDPARPATTFKSGWQSVKRTAGVKGRWHDCRHTFISVLSENPAVSPETVRQLAGHASLRMVSHYSHVAVEAKRRAVEVLATGGEGLEPAAGVPKEVPKVERVQ